ncbi:MAG: hypothetical protein M3Y69_05030 [Verrucomicrobiota bacterium]|nr:hypothetical protein [Verrucomicrobiota bacterium]
MINPNGDQFSQNDGPGSSTSAGHEQSASGVQSKIQDMSGRVSTAASDAWETTKQTAGTARERTEFFLRENPVPTVIGALAIGLAIGLAIRYSSSERETEVKSPLGDVNLGMLSLPFLWPFFKSVKRGYEDSAEVVKDSMRDGLDRVKSVDVKRYVKPVRKQWRSWTR